MGYLTFSFCFLKASVLYACIYMYVYTGFNGVELGPEDVSLLERCPLLGTPYIIITVMCMILFEVSSPLSPQTADPTRNRIPILTHQSSPQCLSRGQCYHVITVLLGGVFFNFYPAPLCPLPPRLGKVQEAVRSSWPWLGHKWRVPGSKSPRTR